MTKATQGPRTGRRNSSGGSLSSILLYGAAIAWTAATLLPLLWLFYSSVKSLPAFQENRWLPTLSPRWENFADVWNGVIGEGSLVTTIPMSRFFLNSVIVTAGSVALTLAAAVLAAYVLARIRIRGTRPLMVIVIVGLAIPAQALVLPIFAMEQVLGLTNNYLGLILPYSATSLPFAILLLRGYFVTFPREVEEASLVDGCSPARSFWSIVLPMTRGPIIAVGVLLANGFWNEFLFALILMPNNLMKTLPVGIYTFVGEFVVPYNLVLAALTLATLPVLIAYAIFQRQITDGMGVGLIKG